MEYEIIYGDVIGKANNYMVAKDKYGGNRIVKNDIIRAYEQDFIEQCTKYKNRLIDGRFKLHAEVYYSTFRFDLDNSLKTILDCLQYVKAITDDSYCVSIIANKHIDKDNPRVAFAIEELEPKLFT